MSFCKAPSPGALCYKAGTLCRPAMSRVTLIKSGRYRIRRAGQVTDLPAATCNRTKKRSESEIGS